MSLFVSSRLNTQRLSTHQRVYQVWRWWWARLSRQPVLHGLLGLLFVSCDPPPRTALVVDSAVDSVVERDAGPQEGGEMSGTQAGEAYQCDPQCADRACGDDGCGGLCGQCAEGERCVESDRASRVCVSGVEDQGVPSSADGGMCNPTCEESGDECGERCGVSCGRCDDTSRCEAGRCICTPQCAGKSCGEDDGCGGRCEPCPRVSSCAECVLRLQVVSQNRISDVASTALVVLSVNLPPQAIPPEVAEFRFKLSGPAILGRVGVGSPVASSGKQLVPDPATGLPYRVDGDTYSVVLLSTQNTDPIDSGEWLFLDLQVSDTSSEPVTLSLIKREQTFAPPTADLILWGEEYTDQVVIWPALRGED